MTTCILLLIFMRIITYFYVSIYFIINFKWVHDCFSGRLECNLTFKIRKTPTYYDVSNLNSLHTYMFKFIFTVIVDLLYYIILFILFIPPIFCITITFFFFFKAIILHLLVGTYYLIFNLLYRTYSNSLVYSYL